MPVSQTAGVMYFKSAAEKVATTSQALGAAMYANAQQSAPAGDAGPSSSESSDDDVVDAEIIDEETDKQ